MKRIAKRVIKTITVIIVAVIAPVTIAVYAYKMGGEGGVVDLTVSIIVGYACWIGFVGIVAIGVPALIKTCKLTIEWIWE